jgi:hypothetical protein
LLISCCLAGFAFNAQAQTAGANEWKRYELGKGNFSVLFPSQPKEDFQPSPANALVPIDLYIYSVETEQGSFVAQYSLLGPVAEKWAETTKEFFYDGVWEGASVGFDKEMEKGSLPFRTKLVEKREIKFSGYAGREVVFTLGPLTGRMRTAIIGRQAFGAMVLGTEEITAEDRQKFFDSYTITPKPIPVEQTRTNN